MGNSSAPLSAPSLEGARAIMMGCICLPPPAGIAHGRRSMRPLGLGRGLEMVLLVSCMGKYRMGLVMGLDLAKGMGSVKAMGWVKEMG